MLRGENLTVYQVVHIAVVELRLSHADLSLEQSGDYLVEYVTEHRLVTRSPDPAGTDRAGQHAVLAVLLDRPFFGNDLGLGIEIVEAFGVRQFLVAVDDGFAADHHAVAGRVNETLDTRFLGETQQVLGPLNVDGIRAVAVFLGDFAAAFQFDDGSSIENGIDVLHYFFHQCLIADIALDYFQILL